MRSIFLVVLAMGVVPSGAAQPTEEPAPFCQEERRREATLDTRGLGALYCTTNAVLTRPLRAAHWSARPVFYGAVPLAWGAAYVREGDDFADAYRLTVAQGTTYGIVLALKNAVGRPRPYVTRALSSRSSHHGPSADDQYRSFPSGHAALSAALVASWGFSYPKWYVVGPGTVWAVSVSLSRSHLGVHYPSDVLVGAVLGVGVAGAVHHFRRTITPAALRGTKALPIRLRIRL